MDINKFAQVRAAAMVPRRPSPWAKIGKNQQLWDLGMPDIDMEDDWMVAIYIKDFERQLDFVLLAEHFDESLVILALMLCWDVVDMRYLAHNARKADKVSNITEEARRQLTNWLAADFQLYKHFEAKFLIEVQKYVLLL